MKQVGTVASLWRYPVKSMGGERIASVYVGKTGLRGDRRLAFMSSAAAIGKPMISGEERTAMLRCAARFATAPEVLSTRFDEHIDPATIEVTLASGENYRADDPALVSALQHGLSKTSDMRLKQNDTPFMDCRPLALMSLQTLAQLSSEVGFPLDPRRFRENLLFDLPGLGGFGEDTFVGRTLRIGEHTEITLKERDPRCRVITVDPATGETDPEIMKLVARAHESRAGVYGVATTPGLIAEGDPVLLLDL